MESGQVYIVHNDWIQNPETGDIPYKIGITKKAVKNRYYDLGLKMPGEFICDFAYEFSNNYELVEKVLHSMLNQLKVNGEWFNINEEALDGIKNVCEMLGGRLITENVEDEIEEITGGDINPDLEKIVNCWNQSSDMKAVGRSPYWRSIRIPGINTGLHYSFTIRNSQEMSIDLGCWTKMYSNMDIILKEYDGYIVNNCQFIYRPPNNQEKRRDWKGSVRTIILLNEVDKIIETMKLFIEQTKDRIIKECLNG